MALFVTPHPHAEIGCGNGCFGQLSFNPMARAVLIGNCSPLNADDIFKAGHDILRLSSVQDTWHYLLPDPDRPTRIALETDIVILGTGFESAIREELMEWIEEETDFPAVLVLADESTPDRLGHAQYSVHDSAADALKVVLRFLDNC